MQPEPFSSEPIDARTLDNGEMFRADTRHFPVTAMTATERRIVGWSLGLTLAVAMMAIEHPSSLRTVAGLVVAAAISWALVAIKPHGAALARE